MEINVTLASIFKNPVNRALVFVQTVANGLELAQHLQCEFYRGSSDKTITNQDRDGMAKWWYEGVCKVMVATDAFGPGNDYPHVRHVFMVGAPRGVVDFVQMAGRGGRDGHVAHIQLYHLKQERITKPVERNADHLGQQDFTLVLSNPFGRCWREIFTKFLDGVGHKCGESAYNWPCPACARGRATLIPGPWMTMVDGRPQLTTPTLPPAPLLPSNPVQSPQLASRRPRAISTALNLDSGNSTPTSIPPPHSTTTPNPGAAFVQPFTTALALHQVRVERLRPLVARVRSALELFAGSCPLCRVSDPSGPPVPVHAKGVIQCPVMIVLLKSTNYRRDRVSGGYLDWLRQKVRYPSGDVGGAVCYRCHVPFFHDMLHRAQMGRGNTSCEESHLDVVGSVAYWVFFKDLTRGQAQKEFGQMWINDEEYGRWLSRREEGGDYTNMIRMFLWVADKLREGKL